MRGTIIVFGGTKSARDSKILSILRGMYKADTTFKNAQNIPDIKILDLENDKKSIGIAQTKEATKFLSEKPFFYKSKSLIIQNADKMTTEAQNSLLKTLEEPPSTALIILNAKNESGLLETVLSRCKRISLASPSADHEHNSASLPGFEKLLKMDIGERLVFTDDFGGLEKDELIDQLEKMLIDARELLMTEHENSEQISKDIKLIYEFIQDLEHTNVSAKFGFERLLVLL